MTVTKTINPTLDVSVNDTFNNTQQFTFLPADIGSGGIINDVNIAITFAKNRTGFGFIAPLFNEIGFKLSYGAINTDLVVGDSSLINNQASFGPGIIFPSFSGTITFDDEAANGVGYFPVAGLFRPAGSLAVFDGALVTPGNAWTLTIYDTSGLGGPVIVDRATLTVQMTPVPEPSTYGLMGAALLLGAVVSRRRRSKVVAA